jgi:hypothetical protein
LVSKYLNLRHFKVSKLPFRGWGYLDATSHRKNTGGQFVPCSFCYYSKLLRQASTQLIATFPCRKMGLDKILTMQILRQSLQVGYALSMLFAGRIIDSLEQKKGMHGLLLFGLTLCIIHAYAIPTG